jgi:hypothetical protein
LQTDRSFQAIVGHCKRGRSYFQAALSIFWLEN